MKKFQQFWITVGLVGAAAIFVAVESLTHWEFFWHLAAIPLEVLVAVFIVERFLASREDKEKRRQLMYIKSHMFLSQMRPLFLANFAALKSPPITLAAIKAATLNELKEMRRRAEDVEYASLEAMEPVVGEYVRAEPVWHEFKDRAITYNFENIFMDMMAILHFVNDVRIFRERHPGRLFVHEAAKRPELMDKTGRILSDGIRRFLEYAIELKGKEPGMFDEMMTDYELSAHLRETA